MLRSRWPIVGGLVIAAALLYPQPGQAQIVTATGRSVEELLTDFRYLAPFVGQAKLAQTVDRFLKDRTGALALKGVDMKRPVALFGYWPEKVTDLWSFDLHEVYLVPVTDDKQFLDLLKRLGCKPRPAERPLVHLTVPGGTELYLRFAHGYAFACEKPDVALLKGQLADPASVLAAGARQGALTATLHVNRFPREYRQVIERTFKPFVEMFDQLAGPDRMKPQETEAEYQQRLEDMKRLKSIPRMFSTFVTSLIEQVQELTLRVDVDRSKDHCGLDLVLVPRPNSTIAAFANHVAACRTRFRPLTRGALFSVLINIPPPPREGKFKPPRLRPAELARVPPLLPDQIPPRYWEAAMQAFGIVITTLAVDGVDFCFAIREPGPKEPLPSVGGLKIQEGRKLDHLLRDLYKNLSAGEKHDLPVQWNHARHARAKIHKLVGEEENYLAIRDDVVFFADGKKGLTFVREALDHFDKAPSPQPTPLFDLRVSSALFGHIPSLSKYLETFPRSARDRLHGRVTLKGGKDLRLHVEMNTYLIKLLHLMPDDEE
jgi:hypothetical protein